MSQSSVLLVEGRDDQHVLYHVLTAHGIACVTADTPHKPAPTINIVQKGGYTALRDSIRQTLKGSELQRLGIVIDADADPAARWQSITTRLQEVGSADIPPGPAQAGTLFALELADRTIDVGIWLMPDNQQPGILEDFIASLRRANDTLWPRAEQCMQQLPAAERLFSAADEPKALVHTWLAWQQEPGKPLGLAIKAQYFDTHTAQARHLVAWARQLFEFG